MVDEFALYKSREMANSLRFYADRHDRSLGLQPDSLDEVINEFYRTAVEISPHLTSKLEISLKNVCKRLGLDRNIVHAFVHNSYEIQAACYYVDGMKCLIRISSALVNLFKENQIEFVIAHEIGHFLLQHAPSGTSKHSPEYFVFQRAKEISADRIGLIGCGSLKTAGDALVQTASGLNSQFLDINLDHYLSQIRQIRSSTKGENPFSTHPSMLIRAFSVNEFARGKSIINYAAYNAADVYSRDKVIKKYLDSHVDKDLNEKVSSAKKDLEMWLAAKHVSRDGCFNQREQLIFEASFGPQLLEKLKVFLSSNETNQLRLEIENKISESSVRLQNLVPSEFTQIRKSISSSVSKSFMKK